MRKYRQMKLTAYLRSQSTERLWQLQRWLTQELARRELEASQDLEKTLSGITVDEVPEKRAKPPM